MTPPSITMSFDGLPMWLPTDDFTSFDWDNAEVVVDCTKQRMGYVFIPSGAVRGMTTTANDRLDWLNAHTDWFVSGYYENPFDFPIVCNLRISFKSRADAMLYKLTWGGK